jgi:hypothetical protein
MKTLRILLLILAAVSITALFAQSKSALPGKWTASYEVEGEEINIQYEFKYKNGKLSCYTLHMKDNRGNGEAYYTLVMSDISFQNGKGTALYVMEYEGEKYEVEASLRLINSRLLKVSYGYYGYSETETWNKVD